MCSTKVAVACNTPAELWTTALSGSCERTKLFVLQMVHKGIYAFGCCTLLKGSTWLGWVVYQASQNGRVRRQCCMSLLPKRNACACICTTAAPCFQYHCHETSEPHTKAEETRHWSNPFMLQLSAPLQIQFVSDSAHSIRH